MTQQRWERGHVGFEHPAVCAQGGGRDGPLLQGQERD